VLSGAQFGELLDHDWPGNVRELRNVAYRFVLGLLEETTGVLRGHSARSVSLGEQIDRFERVLIENALAEFHGNAEAASQCLGISKGTLYEKLRRFELSIDAFRTIRGAEP
jgi:two-component system, NtrC family, C4-dicarboxylate transport response regulator DctD